MACFCIALYTFCMKFMYRERLCDIDARERERVSVSILCMRGAFCFYGNCDTIYSKKKSEFSKVKLKALKFSAKDKMYYCFFFLRCYSIRSKPLYRGLIEMLNLTITCEITVHNIIGWVSIIELSNSNFKLWSYWRIWNNLFKTY